MPDTREDILVRLLTVASGVMGIATAERNAQVAEEWDFPAAIVLDADEQADERASGRGRPANAPNLVAMTPEVYLILAEDAENVGTALNRLRARLIKAVLGDAALLALTADGRGIRYEAAATGLGRGRSMIGEMGVSFTFTYLLKPAEL